ncbi:MAG: hypothetical protein JO339_26215, partial [Alphaproteobacteria bacterium]|nr:hypothetical protein [Alphaproteobacteria bacterium]
ESGVEEELRLGTLSVTKVPALKAATPVSLVHRRDRRQQRPRGSAEIAVAAMAEAHRSGCLERRNFYGAERAEPQLFLDAAFRQQRDAEARFMVAAAR